MKNNKKERPIVKISLNLISENYWLLGRPHKKQHGEVLFVCGKYVIKCTQNNSAKHDEIRHQLNQTDPPTKSGDGNPLFLGT